MTLDPARILSDARRILFVHAHPDDETLASGGLIADLAGRGVAVGVLTCTRGEQGEIVPGALTVEQASDLTAHRIGELEAACRVLGVAWGGFLGEPPARAAGLTPRLYTDSGMRWLDETETVAGPGEDAGADALSLADPAEVAADIAAAAADFGADLIVSYDDHGGYGHPDHVALARPSRDAAASLGIASLELISTLPGSAPASDSVPDAPDPGGLDSWSSESDAGARESKDHDSRPAVIVTVPEHLDTVRRALQHFASQLTVDGDEVVHVGGQRQPIQLTFGLR